jgi:Rrf2 family transcriptional regulator, iron-sulfur cluster assembly transcription factor
MSMFSKTCEYGIKATLHVAQQSRQGKRVGLKDIAKAIDSPEAFTAKIMQQLTRHGIIESTKGPNGGFDIPKDRLKDVKLIQIVSAIDGDQLFQGCGLGLKQCNEEKPCPVHHKFKAIRNNLKKMLEATSVDELSRGLSNGITFLKS